ncbi:MAG: UDP-N-acetylmuramate--L-alanine ligase [Minisyncoccia bacterium]
MINFSNIKKIHFLGIGGAGMIPLVNLFKERDKNLKISGSDIKDFPLRKKLERKGIKIYLSHKKENISKADLVVYSSAIKENNIELKEAKKQKIPIFHRFDALLELLKEKKIIAVSGSHGKSTTTALLGYLLIKSGLQPTIYLGAKTKYWPFGSHWGKGEYAIIETDEHDASFLKTPAYYSIILNVDNDHLDPYGPFLGKFDLLKKAFLEFALKTKNKCVINLDDSFLKTFLAKKKLKTKVLTYSLKNKKATLLAKNIKTLPFSLKRNYISLADIYHNNKTYQLKLKLPSSINISNALAVLNIALLLNIPLRKSLKIIQNFFPVKRRFEIFPYKRITIVDDYAHHPQEVLATLKIAQKLFPHRRIIVVFEPHRFSRVALLYKDFAKIFKNCDFLFLLEIDSAGEINFDSISSQLILKEIIKNGYLPLKKLKLTNYEDIEKEIFDKIKKNDVLIFIGPGKIGNFVINFRKKYKNILNS